MTTTKDRDVLRDRLTVAAIAVLLGSGSATGVNILSPGDGGDTSALEARIDRLEQDVRDLHMEKVDRVEFEQAKTFTELEHAQLRRADEIMSENLSAVGRSN